MKDKKEEEWFLQEALNKGFDKVLTIKPAHLIEHSTCPIVEITEGSTIVCNLDGNLVFQNKFSSSFKEIGKSTKWVGMIYNKALKQWAEIVTSKPMENLVGFNLNELNPYNLEKGEVYYLTTDNIVKWYITNNSENGKLAGVGFGVSVNCGYNDSRCYTIETGTMGSEGSEHAYSNCTNPKFRKLTADEMVWFNTCKSAKKFIPFDEVHKKDFPVLSNFPSDGVCYQPTQELRDYLIKRTTSVEKTCCFQQKGIAWNTNTCWSVISVSSKPIFHISQLEPFFKKEDKNSRELVRGDVFKIHDPSQSIHGIMGIVERVYKNHGVDTVEFQKPLPRHPSGGNIIAVPLSKVVLQSSSIPEHITHYPLTPEECYKVSELPEKWCIKTGPTNYAPLNSFMFEHSSSWAHYKDTWEVEASGLYFHFPPINQVSHSDLKKHVGYTEITTDQLIKHVLTHTDKKQLKNNLNLKQNAKRFNTRENNRESGKNCKICRTHLEIRQGNSIRKDSFRCSTSKIRLRS